MCICQVEPESFEMVTIFFADIVSYTDISAKIAPQKVMGMLDRLYTQFDTICTELGLFKVGTVGDA